MCVRGAAGLTLAAGAVVHELHVIDCVGRLGDKKKSRKRRLMTEQQGLLGTVNHSGKQHHREEEEPCGSQKDWF